MNRATISADIVSSTELTPCVLSQLQYEIDTFINLIGNKYPGTWGRLSKGDSIEIYIDNPQNSLRIALLLKTLIKKFKVDKEAIGENVNKKRYISVTFNYCIYLFSFIISCKQFTLF